MIVRNSVRCRECGTEAVSDNRHDFKSCSCGNVAADGGYDYLRRVGNVGSYDETTIVAPCLATNEAGVRGVLVGFYLLVIPTRRVTSSGVTATTSGTIS